MTDKKKQAPGKEASIQEKLSFVQANFYLEKKDSGNRNAKYWKIEPLKAHFAMLIDEHDLDVCCYINNELQEIQGRLFIKCTATFADSSGAAISVNHSSFLDTSNGGMGASMYAGAAATYCNRYALAALFNITDIELDEKATADDNNPTVDPESPNYPEIPEVKAEFERQQRQRNAPSDKQMWRINKNIDKLTDQEKKMVNDGSITRQQASDIIGRLSKK